MKNNFIVLAAIAFAVQSGFGHTGYAAHPKKLARGVASDKDPTGKIDLSKLNLQPQTLEQVQNFKNNMLKFVLNTTYREDADAIAAFKKLQVYSKRVLPVIAAEVIKDVTPGGLDELLSKKVSKEFKIVPPPAWTVESEVEYMLKETQDLNEIHLTKAEERMISRLDQVDWKKVGGVSIQTVETAEEMDDLIKILAKENPTDEEILKTVKKFEGKFDEHVKKIRHIGDFLSDSEQIKFKNKTLETYVKLLLDGYYDNLDNGSVRNIISDIISMKTAPTQLEAAQIMFMNSGPALGKALQQLGREPELGESIKQIMTVLETKGKRVPQYMALEIINADNGGFKFVEVKDKAWTGTIAQTQPAVALIDGKNVDVAIRFIKPGVLDRMETDMVIMKKIAPSITENPILKQNGMPDFNKVVEMIQEAILEDTDIEAGRKNQQNAYDFYNKSVVIHEGVEKPVLLEFKVPGVHNPPNGKSSLQVSELIKDMEKFAEFYKSKPELTRSLTEEIVKLWYGESIFKLREQAGKIDNLFHGDLHQGNFGLVCSNGRFQCATIETDTKITNYIFDYGMVGTMNGQEQKAFLFVAAGTMTNTPKTIARGLVSLIPSTDGSKPDMAVLTKMIREKMAKVAAEGKPPLKAPAWVGWYLQHGNDIPGMLGKFSRGAGMVNQLPKIVGKEEIMKSALKDVAIRGIKGSVFGRNGYHFPMSIWDIGKVVFDVVADRCTKWFR